MKWITKSFKELTTDELYDFLKLRIDVFVVEQTCYYPDLDDLDRHPETLHLFGYNEGDGKMHAYLRVLPKGTTYKNHISIGRVLIANAARGSGLGHELIKLGINACNEHFNTSSIKISAQEHLAKLYQQHGFKQVTEMYLEDGIPHIGMLKA
ncbi:GNAT family N-acetyltransferase [Thalassotalea atypica]|uniref:GNAT family N-acetyltransferase n=1 Tax=Thalassotalea atypica TaxID=2054316 RepID=UPI002573ECD3|nr:GNAT family N-acetyltransferase [Thalassotalea atypica]